MELHYVLYASRLTQPLGHVALTELLEQSRKNNAEIGLTGFLHIEGDIVLQYLEGPPRELSNIVQRIREDPRHRDFVILAEETLNQRYFEGWRMALVESATLSLFDLLGVQVRSVPQVKTANPLDLINFLSANASFLRDRPSVA